MTSLIERFYALLRWSQRYTKVDMVYLFRGGALLTGADALLTVASLGLAVLIAAYVPKETYGIYRYVLSIAGVAAAFSLTGMNTAVTRAVALGREGSFAASLSIQARYALLQFVVAAAVAGYYFFKGNEMYGIAFAAVALIAPLSGVANTYVAYLNGKKEFARLASWRIQSGVLNILAMVAIVLTSPTIVALTLAYFLSTLLTNLWFLWRTFRDFKPNRLQDPEDLTYGKHLSVMNGIGALATQADAIIVYHLLGPTALAIYSFAILIPERMRSLFGFLPYIALPKLAARSAEERRATAGRRALMLMGATAALAALYAAIAPFIFSFFFPEYLEAIPYSQLAGVFVMATVPTYLLTLLMAGGSQRVLYIVSIATPVFKIALSVVAIVFFGIWGAIAARLIAGVFSGVLTYLYLPSNAATTTMSV